MTTTKYIRSRLAIHEAGHAVANFLTGRRIHSVQITDHEGLVRVEPTEDVFNAVVALMVPHAYEEAFGSEPSGDRFDEDEIERILRRSVSAATRSEAREVLWEAANKLALSAKFDSLLHALSPHLLREGVLTGEEVERILHERLEWERWLMSKAAAAPRRRVEAHDAGRSLRAGPRVRYIRHAMGPDHNPDCVVCLAYPGGPRGRGAIHER